MEKPREKLHRAMDEKDPHELEVVADELERTSRISVDRRSALRTLFSAGKNAATGNVPGVIRALKNVSSEKTNAEQFAETISQTAFVHVAKLISMHLLEKMGVQSGNANITEIERALRQNPIEQTIKTAIAGPVFEELIFRSFPQSFLKESDLRRTLEGLPKLKRWDVGIPVSAVFAGIHNWTDHGFSSNVVPLPQFIGGLFGWYLIRERGLSHSILAHMSNNSAAVAEMLLTRM